MASFNPETFVHNNVSFLKNTIGDKRALVAVSGGVDSTTCAVLTHKAIGANLVCVILDDAFMRKGEPDYVADVLSRRPFGVPTKIVNVQERFMEAMKGLIDAEEKRKRFREVFYNVLSETAKKEGCKMLVQGTIRADIDETVGGIKTQHNVLKQIGINPMERFGLKVVEPLLTLYKQQVRLVARFLGLPSEFSERQPFPGPGLSIRVVGEIHPRKLEIIKNATAIVEKHLKVHTPSQYFAFIIDNNQTKLPLNTTKFKDNAANTFGSSIDNVFLRFFTSRATGIKEGKRQYGGIVGVKVDAGNGRIWPIHIQKMTVLQSKLQSNDPPITRVLYAIKDRGDHRPYVVGIRAVQTQNFLTAKVSDIPRKTLDETAEKILNECHDVSTVYYDVTPKPPATIEME